MNEIRLISIVWLIILSSMSPVIDCGCFDVLQQYFSCKHLKMIENKGNGLKYWYADPSQKVTKLDESFYSSQGLATWGHEYAMTFLQNIYKQTRPNCKSNFCKCVRVGHIDRDGHYSVMFRNAHIYPEAKSIISNFNFLMSQYKLSSAQLQNVWDSSLPTLTKLCTMAEYTTKRFEFFSAETKSCITKKDNAKYLSCMYPSTVRSRSMVSKPTNTDRERYMICTLNVYSSCSSTVYLSHALDMLLRKAPQLVAGKKKLSLTYYLETLMLRSRTHKPAVTYAEAFIGYESRDALKVQTFSKGTKYVSTSVLYVNTACFNTSKLQIVCTWMSIQDAIGNILILSAVNLKFYSPQYRPANRRMDVYFDLNVPKFKNKTYVKDKQKNRLMFVTFYKTSNLLQTEIYEFNTNTYMSFSKLGIRFMAPIQLANQDIRGIFQTGNMPLKSVGPSRRRRGRAVDDCQTVCQNGFKVDTANFPASNRVEENFADLNVTKGLPAWDEFAVKSLIPFTSCSKFCS